MGNKRKIRTYLTFIIIFCICVGYFFERFADFFLGFFAGFYGVTAEYARENFTTMSNILGCLALGIMLAVFASLYRQIRKRVTSPMERLAQGMQEVSRGNLEIRVPVESEFEFYQMEEAFNYMVDELDKAKRSREELKQREQLLYAGIAHDLKTPMTMIFGYAKLLENNPEIPMEDRKKYLHTIMEQTAHANELLDSMLSYSKLNNDAYELKCEKRDIAECLRACVADCYSLFEEKEMELEVMVPEYPIEGSFAVAEMKRVFHNLLINMVKHNPQKTSGRICLELKGASAEGNTGISIVVADDGPKVDAKLQDTLFEPFSVGDSSRATKNGSGLGLSISRKIVEKHGGTLYYVNDWQEGYKAFVIELPGYESPISI